MEPTSPSSLTDEVQEVYSVPLAGGTPTKLNGTLVSGGNVDSFTISADSSRVVYRADQDTDDMWELYASATDADNDGISDYDELNIYGTNPNDGDSDDDGIDDGDEVNYWSTHKTASMYGYDWYEDIDSDGLTNLLDDDSDGDGYLDGEELDAGSNPSNPNSFPGAPIPTLSEWGMVMFFILLAGAAVWVMRRRTRQELV